MTLGDISAMALGNLFRRKGRTLLTVIGVVIGVGALVLMVSLGIGLKQQLLRSFQSQDSLRSLTVTRVQGGETQKKKRIGLFGAVGQIQAGERRESPEAADVRELLAGLKVQEGERRESLKGACVRQLAGAQVQMGERRESPKGFKVRDLGAARQRQAGERREVPKRADVGELR